MWCHITPSEIRLTNGRPPKQTLECRLKYCYLIEDLTYSCLCHVQITPEIRDPLILTRCERIQLSMIVEERTLVGGTG